MSDTTNNKGEGLFFVIALLIIAALVVGFLTLGMAGVGLVAVAITPVIYLILVTLSVGG